MSISSLASPISARRLAKVSLFFTALSDFCFCSSICHGFAVCNEPPAPSPGCTVPPSPPSQLYIFTVACTHMQWLSRSDYIKQNDVVGEAGAAAALPTCNIMDPQRIISVS